jgi:hypothetical protein
LVLAASFLSERCWASACSSCGCIPARAHGAQDAKLQFEIVAVLGLLALFTHIHLFWVAGLLLALIDFPDFSGTFGRMARAWRPSPASPRSKARKRAR